jgi:hypothetical protein
MPRECLKSLIAVTAIAVMGGAALAQNAGPLPQSGMEKPGMTNGSRENGTMDTTGMSAAKGNMKRDKDGAPAVGKKDEMKK